ncbi:cobaltochelatase subunit CobN [Devosia sp. 919]|uniref:cobaltochelatase subunit CobN n=1 Tax=Devosia sp. 919 TaxID=2726065 RepID=UPI001553C069|nr:cobaltochelatase subunit CobN [Devosia sp. 919]
MHLLSAQAGAIQQEGEAIDLAQTPGAFIFASSADSELAMLAAAADRAGETELRLANTLRLSNNLSVDLWLEQTVRHARLVVLRLIGGAAYFQYGVDEITALCANRKIPLALLPGDANPDPILQARSTIHPEDWTRLHALLIAGGPANADAILRSFGELAAEPSLPLEGLRAVPQGGSLQWSDPRGEGHEGYARVAAGEGVPQTELKPRLSDLQPQPFARFSLWHPAAGITDETGLRHRHLELSPPSPLRGGTEGGGHSAPAVTAPHIPILFYRAALEGAGTATLQALVAEIENQGLLPVPILVSSLKEAACVRFVQNVLESFPPAAIFNLTGFALALDPDDTKSDPFSGTDAPVIQLIQSGRSETQWQADPQGLSSKDMAMFLVMPELDGRIGGLLVGHKADAVWHTSTQCPLSAYAPDHSGIGRAVQLARNWARLRATPRPERKLALILANYPLRDGRLANGVGYDAPESTVAILKALDGAGYTLANPAPDPFPSPLRGFGAARRDDSLQWSESSDKGQESYARLASEGGGPSVMNRTTPTPNPSPQGGGEAPPLVFGNGRMQQRKHINRARALRADQTVPERVLWPLLKTFAERGVKFRRQVPLGPYIADFASHHPKLVIELDGETHFTDEGQERDLARTAFLEGLGYQVLRFTNSDVATNQDGIWQTISSTLDGLSAPSLPSPLRGGTEGGGRGVRHQTYPKSSANLITALQSGPTNADPQRGSSAATLSLARYRELFATLPQAIQTEVTTRWGDPATDPFVRHDTFHLPALIFGNVTILLQPGRGYGLDETQSYHDPFLPPPHVYLAAYLWLRHDWCAHALVHNGKHGTLEWLPGKSTALDAASYPDALWGGLPHLYPFIVNDPGEGTQAKRRTGAVIIDHLIPPLTRAETYGPLKDLEALLDEYYAAAGMDRRRLADLRRRILDFTRDSRLDRDIGLPEDETEALLKIDNFLCDLKEAQIRDGLHVFGQSPAAELERDLIVALARVPRGEGPAERSLIRALADDLKLGFDPLTAKLGEPWVGPDLSALASLPLEGRAGEGVPPLRHRTVGDIVEQLEHLAAELVSGPAPEPGWTQTAAVLETVEAVIRPRLRASGPAEMAALLDGLDGKSVRPGPSGAPSRGRLDVLPTGRNFFSVDTRAVPTPTAWELGRKSAENLILRHFQDTGTYLQAAAISVWGTANMRTGGDDLAQAMALIGVKPVWDPGSLRVSGYEIIPLARLGRPRVDVTLRISGFFRDAFPAQITLFDRAVRAVGALDEPTEDNPVAARMRAEALGLMAQGQSEAEAFLAAGHRIFGSRPGTYGAGLGALIDAGTWQNKAELAARVLDWGHYAYGAKSVGTPQRDGFAARLAAVDAVIHNQDNREHDLLDSDNYYQFEGGLAAAAETLSGHQPAAFHNDHSRPERPLIRTLGEEISHVMRSRVVNPKWIAGVKRHGYRGAFEIIATVDFMFAFAATTGAVQTHHFDLAFEAFIEDDATRDFLATANPFGYAELLKKFNEARERGFWTPRSNSAFAYLETAP